MVATTLNIKFNSNFKDAKIVIETIMATLRSEIPYVSEDTLLELRVIYNELINNAIVHGNCSDNRKKVDLAVRIESGLIFSSIADEGEGFDFTEWFISKNSETDIYAERGRGLLLVNSLTDSIAFNGKGNKIDFYKFLEIKSRSEIDTENYSIA